MNVLLAEGESTRRRALRLWLARAGHAVTALSTSAELVRAWHAETPWTLRILDPELLSDLGKRRDLRDDPHAGILWVPRTQGPPICAVGPRVATYCPRARSAETLDALCAHVLAPDTASALDSPTVGELLDAVGPHAATALLARFELDTRSLLATLTRAAARADRRTWQRTLHTLLGSTASIGARGLHDVLDAQRHCPQSAAWTRVAPEVEREFNTALRCLGRAVEVYRAAASG